MRLQLLREVSDLLDVANIQSDLLQRLKGDERIPADRRPAVISDLDGAGSLLCGKNIFISLSDSFNLFLRQFYNGYADQAGYLDLCLLIYQAADHCNPADIRATWQNLLDRSTYVRGSQKKSHYAPPLGDLAPSWYESSSLICGFQAEISLCLRHCRTAVTFGRG